jgi:hypothetical protein
MPTSIARKSASHAAIAAVSGRLPSEEVDAVDPCAPIEGVVELGRPESLDMAMAAKIARMTRTISKPIMV